MVRHGHDFAVVRAPLDHHIDLDRCKADGLSGSNAFQHVVHREIGVVHAPE